MTANWVKLNTDHVPYQWNRWKEAYADRSTEYSPAIIILLNDKWYVAPDNYKIVDDDRGPFDSFEDAAKFYTTFSELGGVPKEWEPGVK